MMRATIWRDSHSPHARSGGSTALICRRVRLLTAAALRERPLDGVGGWVFTRVIEHTFENRVVLMMQEVLL